MGIWNLFSTLQRLACIHETVNCPRIRVYGHVHLRGRLIDLFKTDFYSKDRKEVQEEGLWLSVLLPARSGGPIVSRFFNIYMMRRKSHSRILPMPSS